MERKHSKELSADGERFIPGCSNLRNQEDHVARYTFAQRYIQGKVVLDIACGTGYGSDMMARGGAERVVGIDIDAEAVRYAKDQYSAENSTYLCGSAEKIELPDSYFDVIVSFETIEHLDKEVRTKYLQEMRRVLKDDGLIILSTPNKLISSPWSVRPLNPFHQLEFYRSELERELVESKFAVVAWFGQRFVKKIFTMRPVYIAVRVVEKVMHRHFHIYDVADSAEVRKNVHGMEQRYFVVLVTK